MIINGNLWLFGGGRGLFPHMVHLYIYYHVPQFLLVIFNTGQTSR